jgi:hypothetical protein
VVLAIFRLPIVPQCLHYLRWQCRHLNWTAQKLREATKFKINSVQVLILAFLIRQLTAPRHKHIYKLDGQDLSMNYKHGVPHLFKEIILGDFKLAPCFQIVLNIHRWCSDGHFEFHSSRKKFMRTFGLITCHTLSLMWVIGIKISYPRLPSGRVYYAMLMKEATIYGDGNAPNVLTDNRDIGRFVARIIKDERTLNKRVFTHSDVLTQKKKIWTLIEEKSWEKVETQFVRTLFLS